MNIHPLVVHFPIALLTLYAMFEMISFGRLGKNMTWKIVKTVLLVCGFLSSFVAIQTGEMAEHITGSSDLVKKHEFFGMMSVWLFAIPVFGYVVFFCEKTKIFQSFKGNLVMKLCSFLSAVSRIIMKQPVLFLFALLGFLALSIAGALGGALVHGKNVDPIVEFFYNLVM